MYSSTSPIHNDMLMISIVVAVWLFPKPLLAFCMAFAMNILFSLLRWFEDCVTFGDAFVTLLACLFFGGLTYPVLNFDFLNPYFYCTNLATRSMELITLTASCIGYDSVVYETGFKIGIVRSHMLLTILWCFFYNLNQSQMDKYQKILKKQNGLAPESNSSQPSYGRINVIHPKAVFLTVKKINENNKEVVSTCHNDSRRSFILYLFCTIILFTA